jgi:hypothetical protein
MDAMIVALLVLLRLLLYRPMIFVMLLLVYAVPASLLFTADTRRAEAGLAIAAVAAFAAGALTALLTDRIKAHSLQAGAIGLPDHSHVIRRVQACFLVLFAAMPAAVACVLGAEPLATIAALAAATAAGILIGGYRAGGWLLLVPVLGKVFPLADWAALPAVQALATSVGAYVIWSWFELPSKVERTGALAGSRLADARHERSGRLTEPKDSTLIGESVSSTCAESLLAPSSTDTEGDRRLPTVLALGLGYSLRIDWRRVLYGAGIAIVVLAGWRALDTSKPTLPPYLIITGFCCVALMGRLQAVLQRWKQTANEQALLCLTPGWPEARSIKRAVLWCTLTIQRGSIAVWAAVSAVATLLGWIDKTVLLAGVLAILGTSCAFSGAVWAVLAHRRVREWHYSTIVSALSAGAGALTIFFGSPALNHPLAAGGAALMIAPPALGLAWYALAPLRMPINVDTRAL